MRYERGVSLTGLLVACVILVFVALLGFKVFGPITEYLTIKKDIRGMIESGELRNATVSDVRRAFDRRASIDNIESIGGGDLDVSKEGDEIVISFAYPKKVHLFYNLSLLFDFEGNSKR